MKFLKIGPEFTQTRTKHLRERKLFEDVGFPAVDTALFHPPIPGINLTWVRPGDLCATPKLFHSPKEVFNVDRGIFSNSWLLSAMDTLSQQPKFLHFVVPADQSFSSGYAGIFRFRIWRYGVWYEVTVDDRLPFDSENNTLLGIKSLNDDFWTSLLEKAYAKVLGKYEDLKAVVGYDALEDFTGGLGEIYSLQQDPLVLYHVIRHSLNLKCHLIAFKDVNMPRSSASYRWNHVFVNALEESNQEPSEEVDIKKFFIRIAVTHELVFDKETGHTYYSSLASDDDIKTRQLVAAEREIWMLLGTFLTIFKLITVLNVSVIDSNRTPKLLYEFHGAWVVGKTSGGCIEESTFSSNPRHYFILSSTFSSGMSAVIVSLMQKTKHPHERHKSFNSIGFYIYNVPSFHLDDLDVHQPYAMCRHHTLRGVAKRFQFPSGKYIIVPCTYKRDHAGSYLLRILSDKAVPLHSRIHCAIRPFMPNLNLKPRPVIGCLIVILAIVVYFILS